MPALDPTFAVRSYATRFDDLDLELAAGGRAERVTRLLKACLPGAGDEVWGWSLHRRLQALLAIELASGGRRIALEARCRDPDCREPVELELDVTAFVLGERPESAPWRGGAGPDLTLRVPRGDDQRAWEAAQAAPAPWEMARALLATTDGAPLPADFDLGAALLDAMGQQLEVLDPLNALVVAAACPACGRHNEIDVDLEALLLARAATRQRELLDVIHRLARAYHWSEVQILALPPCRRAMYLQRIERDLTA